MIVQGCASKLSDVKYKSIKKIAFFDRDGVINRDLGYVHKKKDFILEPGIEEFLKRVQENGFLIVVVTNQSGIERGYYTASHFYKFTNWYTDCLKKSGIRIAMTLFCPHMPAENSEKNCPFRKPNPMMINVALKYYNADAKKCFLVGDNISDLRAAQNAGVKTTFLYRNPSELVATDPDIKTIRNFREIRLDGE